jgi:HlyD family secretion protein
VFVTAISGGQVAEIASSDGVMVAAGTPLARLSNPALELDVASRSADIAGQLSAISGQRLSVQTARQTSGRDVADARNALSKAQTLLAQKQVLFEKGIITRAAIDPVRQDVTFQTARVAALDTGMAQAGATLADQSAGIAATARQLRESLAMVRASLSALVLRAPVAGRLTAFTLQPGQTLKSGDPVGQIDSEGQWKLTADVDQYYLGRVRTGLAATADLDGRSYPMTVLKILPQVTEGRFRIELAFRGAAPIGLNRGQTLDVRLVLGADRPAVVAPSGGWLDAGGTTAFVLDGDARAVRRAIVTGRRNPDQVEIVSGLAPGERIVTTALNTYAPFQTLLIR